MVRIGVYGFECTKEILLDGYSIIPLYKDGLEVKTLSRDEACYHLTAILVINNTGDLKPESLIFDLEGVLSFVTQKDIIIKNRLRDKEAIFSLDDDFPTKLTGCRRANRGSLVISDNICKESASLCISLAMNVLSGDSVEGKVFRKALFKNS
ncbi:hypothetical protein [Vibrio variabilis]|uniref:hypothetical protein n=1 Tax=Vibrio variabilis TaxID=990271 RepID=UPI000DD5756C|nr:hypothetical protein [Vibrio variabilis]